MKEKKKTAIPKYTKFRQDKRKTITILSKTPNTIPDIWWSLSEYLRNIFSFFFVFFYRILPWRRYDINCASIHVFSEESGRLI